MPRFNQLNRRLNLRISTADYARLARLAALSDTKPTTLARDFVVAVLEDDAAAHGETASRMN